MAKILLVFLTGGEELGEIGLARLVNDTPDLRTKIGQHYNARRKARKSKTECPRTDLIDLFYTKTGLRKGVFDLSEQYQELNNVNVLLVDLECHDYTPHWKREGYKSQAAYDKDYNPTGNWLR